MANADLIIAQAALMYDRAWSLALQKSNAADDRVDEAIALAGGVVPGPVVPDVDKFTPPDEPDFPDFSSDTARADELSAEADELTDRLANEFYVFLAQNFPPTLGDLDVDLDDLPSLAGIDAEQIWQAARNRALRDSTRAEQEALAQWGARGYALPPGAAAGQLAQIRQETRDRLAEASRDASIAEANVEADNARTRLQAYVQQNGQKIELARAQVDAAIRARTAGVAAAIEYMRALALPVQIGADVTTAVITAKAGLSNAMSAVYRTQVDALTAISQIDLTNTDFRFKAQQAVADITLRAIDQRVNAAISAAQAAATQAGAALNVFHSNAGMSASAQVEDE